MNATPTTAKDTRNMTKIATPTHDIHFECVIPTTGDLRAQSAIITAANDAIVEMEKLATDHGGALTTRTIRRGAKKATTAAVVRAVPDAAE